jgi:hypothetical protein
MSDETHLSPLRGEQSRPGDLAADAAAIAAHQPHASFLPQRWEQIKTDPDISARRQREGMRLLGLAFPGPMSDLPTGNYGDSESAPPPMAQHQPVHPPSWADWTPTDGQTEE